MERALELHGAIVRVARGQGALHLALGEGLLRLFIGDRLLRLGYSTARDYTRERLGIPVRTMKDALLLARACCGRTLLRKAVASGLVSPCKARTIASVVAENESQWTALAMTSTVRELKAAVRAAGKEPPEDLECESLRLKMTPEQQDKLDRALALAAEVEGGGVPRWRCYEALAQEWLAEHGGRAPEERGAGGPSESEATPFPECVTEHLAAIEEAEALVEDRAPDTNDPKELEAFVLRLARACRGFDVAFGPLAVRVVDERAWAAVGCASLKEYCTERLGMAPSAFRQRVWLERRMFALPQLKEALRSGRLTYSKAVLVAQDATPETVEDLIAKAADTTWQQTDREATAREDARNRAKGLRRLWGPKDVMETVVTAIVSAQRWSASQGRRIDAGEALVVIAEYFLKEWRKLRRRRRARARQQVLGRDGGTCEVPGCSLPARHVHHIRYRSHGGSEAPWNKVRLCVPHHLRGVHMGYLKVEGRAGERLVWRFGNGEIWVTNGDDNVRRGGGGPGTDGAADRVAEPSAPRYGREAVIPSAA
jgi:hypothetical protein